MTVDVSRRRLIAGELTLKVNRFELSAIVLAALVLAVAGIVAAARFASVGATHDCLLRWIASLPVGGPCSDAVQRWSDYSVSGADQIMSAMFVFPPVAGILAGVPLVGREIEAGTAPLAWAIAGSRTRWLARVAIPVGALLAALLVADAVAAGILADARSAGNIWSSTYGDSALFGAPAVARGMLAFAVGIAVGAAVGRMLPAVLIALAVIAILTVAIGPIGGLVVRSTYTMVDVGAPGSAVAFVEGNPDTDVYFVTEDGELLSKGQAAQVAPAGTTDPVLWLADHARLVTLGVSREATARWQLVLTAVDAVLAAIGFALAVAIVRRRSPR